MPDDVVRLLIGVIGVALRAQCLVRQDAAARPAERLRGVFWGAGSGFTSTIASAGMPPFSVHVLPHGWTSCGWSAPSTMFFAAVNVMRIVPYFALGHLSRETLLISLALMPLAIATNFLGFWLVQRIPTVPFYRISYALMFLISAVLLAQGVAGLWRACVDAGQLMRLRPMARAAGTLCGTRMT